MFPFQHKEVLIVADHLRVNARIGAMTERQVIDSIKQICLSLSVMSYKTIDFGRQF
jgi:hypothetical protein